MNASVYDDPLKEHWNELRSYVRERWPDIDDTELDIIDGDTARLIGALQEHYWIRRDEAAYHVHEFEKEFLAKLGHPTAA